MLSVKFLASFVDTELITILFTWLMLGASCYAMFVLPQRQTKETARGVKPTSVEALPKAA